MYVASCFATGHRDKIVTSVWDYEKAAFSLPTRCHLLFLVYLDRHKKCALTQKCRITIYLIRTFKLLSCDLF